MTNQRCFQSASLKFSSIALVVFGVLTFGLSACGGSGASQEELESARKQGAAKARQQAKIGQIQHELRELKKGNGGKEVASGSSPAPEGGSGTGSDSGNCGGSLSANSNTTCGFAENVQQAYFEEIGSGSGTVIAFSPTTGKTYSMDCTAGSPHECSGGNNAAVFFP